MAGDDDKPRIELCCRTWDYPELVTSTCTKIPLPNKWTLRALKFVVFGLTVGLGIYSIIQLAEGSGVDNPGDIELGEFCSLTGDVTASANSTNSTFVAATVCYDSVQISSQNCSFQVKLFAEYNAVIPGDVKGIVTTTQIIDTMAYILLFLGLYISFLRYKKTINCCTMNCAKLCGCTNRIHECMGRCKSKIDGVAVAFDVIVFPILFIMTIIAIARSTAVSSENYYVTRTIYERNNGTARNVDVGACTNGDGRDGIVTLWSPPDAIIGTGMTSFEFALENKTISEEFAAEWEEELKGNIHPGILVMILTLFLISLDCYLTFLQSYIDIDNFDDEEAAQIQPNDVPLGMVAPQPAIMQTGRASVTHFPTQSFTMGNSNGYEQNMMMQQAGYATPPPGHMSQQFAAPPGHMSQQFAAPPGHMSQQFAAPPGHVSQQFAAPPGHMSQQFAAPPGHQSQQFYAPQGHMPQQYPQQQGHFSPQQGQGFAQPPVGNNPPQQSSSPHVSGHFEAGMNISGMPPPQGGHSPQQSYSPQGGYSPQQSNSPQGGCSPQQSYSPHTSRHFDGDVQNQ